METLKLIVKYKIIPLLKLLKLTIKKLFKKDGITMVGYFDAPIGTSEVGRQCFLDFIKHSRIPCKIYNYDLPSYETQAYLKQPDFAPWLTDNYDYSTNILFFNADHVADIMDYHFVGKPVCYNVGVFWWELEEYFYFDRGTNAVDEIIVFSEFIRKAILKSYPSKKVTKLTFPFTMPSFHVETKETTRARYGLSKNDFVFFFNFDFFSVYERKNPEGLIRSFAKSFVGHSDVKLLLKTIHGNRHLENFNKFHSIVQELGIEDQVIVLDKNFEKTEMMTLLKSCDCYISLHRSEGLGIGMMEAMSLNVPVIATAYGGNMEFTNDENSLLVDFDIVEIEQDNGPYKKGYKWAQPKLDDASKKMLRMYNEPELRTSLAEKGNKFIREKHMDGKFANELAKWYKKIKK